MALGDVISHVFYSTGLSIKLVPSWYSKAFVVLDGDIIVSLRLLDLQSSWNQASNLPVAFSRLAVRLEKHPVLPGKLARES